VYFTGFHCYSDGCSALVYAPCHQAIISGGKKGELYIYDVRQRQLRHTFQAHQSAIKCISFDPTEDSFATGSADGEVKVRPVLPLESKRRTYTVILM